MSEEAGGPAELPIGLERIGEALFADPGAFTFFQAVRLLERLRPDRDPVGGFGDPGAEVVRFSPHPSLAFPTGELESLTPVPDGPPRMSVNFFGLVGPQGLLPHHYTLLTALRLRAKDAALRDFLDIFQHRAISLLYLAWMKYRVSVRRERQDVEDTLARHLLDLVGLGTSRHDDVIGDPLVPYAGLLGPQPRSAAALEQLLAGYFEVPVEIEQFVGGWYALHRDEQCEVGGERSSARLGYGSVVGREVWDPQARVRVRLGPLSRERFERFLPGGEDHEPLRRICRFFGHAQFDFEARLVLVGDDVTPCVLDEAGEETVALGWSTWIGSGSPGRSADETILTL